MKKTSNYFPLAFNFWNLVTNSINEMEKQGNLTQITRNFIENESEEESLRIFREKTKWNDNNIAIPLLFNFYHGIELYMKGLFDLLEIKLENKNHKIREYLVIIQEKDEISNGIKDSLNKYIYEIKEINDFLSSNNSKIDDFVHFFKYPESKNGHLKFSYYKIRGKENETLKLYSEIKNGISILRKELINWNVKRIENE